MPIPKDPVTEPEREKLEADDLENKPEASSEEDSCGAAGSATLTMDQRTAYTIVAALKMYEGSFYTEDQGGRLRMADAQYIRETIEDAIEDQWPNGANSPTASESEVSTTQKG